MSKIKKPIYEPPEIDESTMTEQEVAVAKRKETLHKIRERKIKKAFKTYRFRGLKNFLFWFFGVMSSVGIILGSIFIGVKVIPISTYLKWSGQDASEIVSEDISGKSVLDAFLSLEEYTFSDVPVIETMVKDLLAETGVDDFVTVDYSALKDVKLLNKENNSDLIDEVSKCVKLNPEAQMFSGIKAIIEHVETENPLTYNKSTSKWEINEGVKTSLYCFAVVSASGGAPANAKFVASHAVEYQDAFPDGELNKELASLTENEMKEVIFYYKPLCTLPLFELVDDVDIILSRIGVSDVLAMVGIGEEVDPLINKLFEGSTIGDLIKDFTPELLLKNFKLIDVKDIKITLDKFAGLDVFSEWKSAGTLKDLDLSSINENLLYYIAEETNDGKLYEKVFVDNTKVDKVTEDTELFYANLLEIPVNEALDIIQDRLGLMDLTELLEKVMNMTSENIIYEIFDGLKIGDFYDEGFNPEIILEKLTLNTLGGTSKLGELGKVLAYSEWKEVRTKPEVIQGKLAEGLNPEIYYYLQSGTHGEKTAVYAHAFNLETGECLVADETTLYFKNGWEEVLEEDFLQIGKESEVNTDLYYYLPQGADETDDKAYLPAFDEDGNLVDGANGDNLYYANLNTIQISKLINVISDSIGRKQIVTLLENLGAELNEGDLILEILADKKVSEMGQIESNTILMDKVLPYNDNKDMYKIILSALNKMPTREEGQDDNSYYAQVEKVALALTISDLAGKWEITNISLSTVMPYSVDNKELYEILLMATNNLPIQGENEQSSEYEARVKKAAEALKISSISSTGFKIENVLLSRVLKGDNETLKKILGSTIKVEGSLVAYENLTIGMLKNFNTETLLLDTVLPYSSSTSGLYKILVEACNKGGADNVENLAKTITIKDLESFSLDNLTLSIFGDKMNSTLKTVITEACNGTDFNSIKVSSLDSFDIKKVQLSTVMEKDESENGNKILNAIIDRPGVTIGTLGSTINSLTLYELYGKDCFTTNENEAVNPSIKFRLDESNKSHVMYVHDDENGTYYLHKDDGIWLLLCFDFEDVSEITGRPEHYVLSNLTLSSLSSASELSKKFTNATIAQLVDAGLLSNISEALYPYTLQQALNMQTKS